MDIFEKLHDEYNEISLAGYELGDTYKAMIAEYQTRWDAGDRFDLSKIGPMNLMDPNAWKRDPADEEDELNACITELAGKVKTALLEKWAMGYTQSRMQGIINALATLDWNGKLLIHGMDVSYNEVVSAWNKAHPDDEQVYLDAGLEI